MAYEQCDPLGCAGLVDLPPAAQRGFYASGLTGWASSGALPDPRLECLGAGRPAPRAGLEVLYGCGAGSGVTIVGAARCGGYDRVVGCGGASPWRCDGGAPGELTLTDPRSGVMCCPAS